MASGVRDGVCWLLRTAFSPFLAFHPTRPWEGLGLLLLALASWNAWMLHTRYRAAKAFHAARFFSLWTVAFAIVLVCAGGRILGPSGPGAHQSGLHGVASLAGPVALTLVLLGIPFWCIGMYQFPRRSTSRREWFVTAGLALGWGSLVVWDWVQHPVWVSLDMAEGWAFLQLLPSYFLHGGDAPLPDYWVP